MFVSYKSGPVKTVPTRVVDTPLVQEEFEWTYHLLNCFPGVSSLVEPVAKIEEIQRV